MINKNTTLSEIAEMTGFSVITISRALNYPDKVKEDTRNIILKACKEKNYKTNSVARALKSNSTNIISVYIPSDISARNPFYTELVSAIGETLGTYGYSMLLVKNLTEPIRCDGCIYTSLTAENTAYIEKISKEKQVVLFGHSKNIDSIDVNNRSGMKMMTQEVLKRNAKKILYVSIDQDRLFIKDREQGFLDAVKGLNVEYKIVSCKNNLDSGFALAKSMEKEIKQFDSIVCASDDIAIGMLEAIRRMDVKVPEETQISGFDGFGTELHIYPNISTIKQPIFEIGQLLAERLVNKIKSKEIMNHLTLIDPTFVDNGSLR